MISLNTIAYIEYYLKMINAGGIISDNQFVFTNGSVQYKLLYQHDERLFLKDDEWMVRGSDMLQVFILYLIVDVLKVRLPERRFFSSGFTKKAIEISSVFFTKVDTKQDYIESMLKIDKKYPEFEISKQETLDGEKLITGEQIKSNPFSKYYVEIHDDSIVGKYWERGRVDTYSEFKNWQLYFYHRLNSYVDLITWHYKERYDAQFLSLFKR